jgi:hypothetical protein
VLFIGLPLIASMTPVTCVLREQIVFQSLFLLQRQAKEHVAAVALIERQQAQMVDPLPLGSYQTNLL